MGATAYALREALMLALVLALPPLVAVLVVGIAAAVLQTMTQVRERSLSAVPRMVAALVALALAGPWIAARAQLFLQAVLAAVPALGRSG
jgi:flagellar biosynthetic protein FliQ